MEITCIVCKTRFKRKSNKGRVPQYCSERCYFRYWKKKNPGRWETLFKNLWRNKILEEYSCCVCGFNRALDRCHIKWNKDGGKISKDNITILCPNHHRLFDRGLLTSEERDKVKTVSAILGEAETKRKQQYGRKHK